jgi:2',3'-cyclic-nucleotide 2'-phosphodiesterase (5'-nucleotidase family)
MQVPLKAQQAIINLPSADITPKNKLFVMNESFVKMWGTDGHWSSTNFITYGLNENWELAITNYGGLRVNRWAQGAILIRNVYELMPFDNALVVLDVPGAVLQQWMAHMAKMGGWPIAGVCVRADTLRNTYQLSNCTAGVPLGIEMQKTYRVATSDYIANGGDRCDFLIGLKQQNTGLLLRDALLQYLKQTKNIQPNSQNRFTFQTKP